MAKCPVCSSTDIRSIKSGKATDVLKEGSKGAAAGAAVGAALGSVVPFIGTAIGGWVGGALGATMGASDGIGNNRRCRDCDHEWYES